MNNLQHYQYTAADWRKTLRQNSRRTTYIVIIFFLIYGSIGLLIDLYMNLSSHPTATLSQLFYALITFHLTPIATLILLAIAGLSLIVAYKLYDKLMLLGTNYHEITPSTAKNIQEKQLYNVVEEMKIAAGLAYMPKVFIIDADYMNAFASGYSEKSSMLAITRGLMEKLNRDELQAVMAHELSHIRHMDIKLSLTASLLSNLTIIVLDILFYNAIFSRRDDRSKNSNIIYIIIIVLRYLLPVVSLLLLLYLSRTRELMADAGSVELMRTNEPLANALMKIENDHATHKEEYAQAYMQTPHEQVRREAYIYDPTQAGIEAVRSVNDLFSTHPSLATRLKALGYNLKNE